VVLVAVQGARVVVLAGVLVADLQDALAAGLDVGLEDALVAAFPEFMKLKKWC
jgi:hypothetical protein